MWIKHAQPALSAVPQQADAAATNSTVSLNTALARAKLAPRIALQSLKLADAIKATDGNHTQRMHTVVDLLQADAERPESLIDLSLVVEGGKVRPCVRAGTAKAS